MEERGQVILRYVDAKGDVTDAANPNGSMRSIAGIANQRFNVFGLMPHPEHAVEAALFGADGRKIFESIIGFEMQLRSATKRGESFSPENAEFKREARRLGILKSDEADKT